jgi:glutamine amidotransferase-like uncharacterized protein
MSRKHQVLIYDPSSTSDLLVQSLKNRLNPHYVVHPVSYASLQSDPWEEQCAVLFVIESEVGGKVRERVRRYVESGGRVVGCLMREGSVGDILAGGAVEGVRVKRSER